MSRTLKSEKVGFCDVDGPQQLASLGVDLDRVLLAGTDTGGGSNNGFSKPHETVASIR